MFANFDELVAAAAAGPQKTIAIAAAADKTVMHLAAEIQKTDLCRVILVDDEEKIQQAAEDAEFDLAGVTVVNESNPEKIPPQSGISGKRRGCGCVCQRPAEYQ